MFKISAQIDGTVVKFSSGDKVLVENVQKFATNPEVGSDEIIDGYYYRYVQFNAIPTVEEQERFKSTGLQIMEYVPYNVYLVAVPDNYNTSQFLSFDIRSVVAVEREDKLDQRLLNNSWPDWANAPGNQIKVMIKTYSLSNPDLFITRLQDEGLTFAKKDIHFPYIFTTVSTAEILSIASLPFVQYLDIGPDPGEPEDTGGRTLQRANLIDSEIAGGLRYNGAGVNIQVRDDGVVGPHIDFQGRLFDFTGGSNTGTHGDGVAGVFAGAGNLEPDVEGGASGANVYVTNYESTFTDNTLDLHQNNDVVITNSSYSNGCNAGYTTTTQRVDQQMIDNPNLMHVFSAGNSNGNDCGYGAGTQWGNITGGHKQGKNVMAVANLFANANLVGSSSRGPAHDGRIKPDISAHGQNERSTSTNNSYQTFGGTSSAAPTMAGSFAQLYHAYRALNGGANPNTGFLKAVVLNSAKDMGNTGPDFKFGWGRIDAYQALQILEDQTYLSSSLSQGVTQNHTINVPAGVAEVRVMVYWVDPAGAVNSSIALVNNLDIHLIDPLSIRRDPWVLDHTPDATTLDLPATRGVDNRNNMEQVAINNPGAGAYNLAVQGTSIPVGVQEYYVVWSFLYDEIKVTYPNGGEGLVPGQSQLIHWDAIGNQGTFNIDYSTNNGGSWTSIASGVNGATRLMSWTTPNVVTGETLVRVTRGAKSDISDAKFSIISLPGNISTTNPCQTGVTLTWNAVSGADQYNVYQLGEKYMEIIGTTASLSYEISDLPVEETIWFSVQAINNQGVVGKRANAISYFTNPAFINCRNTIKIEKSTASVQASSGDTIEYMIKFTSFYDVPITNVIVTDVLDPTWLYIDNSLTCGTENNNVITLNHGTVNPDQMISCSFKAKSDILSFSEDLFTDDLEGGTASWTIDNQTGPETWSLTTDQSNSPTNSWFSPDPGNEVNTNFIVSEPIVLGSSSELTFSHLYNTEQGWDGGFVEISTDNGTNWEDLGSHMIQNGYNGGLGNGANPFIANRPAFTGNSGGFVETKVDLSSFDNATVLIRFVFGEDSNTGGVGWYVDDILVRSVFYQTNMACVTYDQGDPACDSATTLMLPCQNNCDPCSDGVMNGDETDIDCGGSLC